MNLHTMFSLIKKSLSNIYLLFLLVLAAILRLINLGYSDYQGDEIKALYIPSPDQNIFSYLLDQRKGPMQFFITYLMKFIDPNFTNEFLMRLPFAIAGILAVVFFYKFVKMHFGKLPAFFAAFFLASNGFFVAFSRIVQYQSFVILFMILCLYFLTLAVKSEKLRVTGLYLGLIFWALSILSHYDGVFIAPFVLYLLFEWFKDPVLSKKSKIKHFIFAGIAASVLLLSFYVPFVVTLSKDTKDYWLGRITGNVADKVSSSRYLFTAYQPIYVIHIYYGLFVLGFVTSLLLVLSKKIGVIKKYISKVSDVNILLVTALFGWFALAFLCMEVLVKIPGTHIYTYLVPLFIIMSLGIKLIEHAVELIFTKIALLGKMLFTAGSLAVIAFVFAQSYAVFVDNYQEYPWENETFFIWTLPRPSPTYHLSMFGFPYYRNWEGIKKFTTMHPDVTAYSTNERVTIARYYMGMEKGSDEAGFFIYIRNPQSFINDIKEEKNAYWVSKYTPVYTFTRNGHDLVRVYIMQPGKLKDIVAKGY
jgi:4-amino-4-deoxy-L-arabinose transferase-like glycosyltransferase